MPLHFPKPLAMVSAKCLLWMQVAMVIIKYLSCLPTGVKAEHLFGTAGCRQNQVSLYFFKQCHMMCSVNYVAHAH